VSFPLLNARSIGCIDVERAMDPGKSAREDANDLSGLRVMIVDDERDARDVLVAVLEQRGAKVTAAASASEALEALARASNGSFPDVLVSDIGMPGEDGFDLIARVRALEVERGGHIPAIALTAYARAEDRARVLAAGFQRHVAKPVEPSTLATTVFNLARRAAKA
jgi:CheY-like chemotaxis protein